jgi:hypothetical protein
LNRLYKYIIFILPLILLLLFTSTGPAFQQNVDTNAKVKAMFVYGFTKNIEWPQTYKDGNFIIGILGNTTLLPELNKLASTYKVGNQAFEIKNFSNASSIGKCHMLIISPEGNFDLNEIISKTKNNSTLLITEKVGWAKQGAAINFVIQNNKQAFELNKQSAEKFDLKVSANLTTLAVAVF